MSRLGPDPDAWTLSLRQRGALQVLEERVLQELTPSEVEKQGESDDSKMMVIIATAAGYIYLYLIYCMLTATL